MNGGAIIGGLHEYGLNYMETPSSGMPRTRRIFDAGQMGWMIQYQVAAEYWCKKSEINTIMAAIPIYPIELLTNAGRLTDGSTAPRINWGSGYVLDDLTSSPESPSLVRLNATYLKTIPEAQISLPTGLTLTCVAGKYTLKWLGDTFLTFDAGTGICGAGMELEKLPAEVQVYEVVTTKSHTEDGPLTWYYASRQLTYTAWYYYRVYYPREKVTVVDSHKRVIMARTYQKLALKFDGVTYQVFRVPGKETVLASEEFDGAATPSFTPIGEVELGTVDYSADLKWEIDGNTCRLLWCNEPFLIFIHEA